MLNISTLPAVWPDVPKLLTQLSVFKWRYYMNVVTHSYSAAFWDTDRWMQEIDWMALSGVNLPLAFTGYVMQEGLRETRVGGIKWLPFTTTDIFLALRITSATRRWQGPAFGLRLELELEVPSFPPSPSIALPRPPSCCLYLYPPLPPSVECRHPVYHPCILTVLDCHDVIVLFQDRSGRFIERTRNTLG